MFDARTRKYKFDQTIHELQIEAADAVHALATEKKARKQERDFHQKAHQKELEKQKGWLDGCVESMRKDRDRYRTLCVELEARKKRTIKELQDLLEEKRQTLVKEIERLKTRTEELETERDEALKKAESTKVYYDRAKSDLAKRTSQKDKTLAALRDLQKEYKTFKTTSKEKLQERKEKVKQLEEQVVSLTKEVDMVQELQGMLKSAEERVLRRKTDALELKKKMKNKENELKLLKESMDSKQKEVEEMMNSDEVHKL